MTKAKGRDTTGGVMPDPNRATIKEIAEALSISKSQGERNALSEGWVFEEEAVRGGKRRLYPLTTLPDSVRAAVRVLRYKRQAGDQARVATLVEDGGKQAAAVAEAPIGEAGQIRRDVRLAILSLWDRHCAETGQSRNASRFAFTDLYNEPGAIAVPAWVRDAKRTISPNSLLNWDARREDGRLNTLAGAYGGRKDTSVFGLAQGIYDHITAGILKGRSISARDLLAELRDAFGDRVDVVMPITGEIKTCPLPTARSLQRWIAAWRDENKELIVRETDPDRWKSGYRVAVGDLYGWVRRPNQLWEIDASPADLLLTDGRYSLYVLIDIFTRRIMVLVSKTPRTEAALLLLKRGIEAWGKPETVRTDRGSDFISHDAKRFFALLRIIHDECDAYSPEQKGAVERHVKTVQHGIIAQLPGFIGHSVADRKVIESRKAFAQRLGQSDHDAFEVALTRDDLQVRLDDWCEYVYGRREHGGLNGKSPWQMISEWTGPIMRIDDPARLGLLLAPAPKGSEGRDGIRVVTKKGIRVENAHFWDDTLTLFMREQVFVRLDPHDMGAIWVFAEDHSEFICKAINVEREGIDRAAMAAKAHAAQKEHLAELRAKHRAARRGFRPHVMVERRLVEAKAAGDKVVHLPRPAEAISTPALDAIGAAMQADQRKIPVASPVTEAEQAAMERMAAEAAVPAQVITLDTVENRLRRVLEIEARIERGEAVSEEDRRWAAKQSRLPDIRARRDMMQDFGEAVLTA